MKWEVRYIDAWRDCEGWVYNATYRECEFTTKSENVKRAFLHALHKVGIVCKRGACVVEYDGDCYELRERKSGMPLFAALPME